ncbi:putative ribonuclease H-like domain-containing protein [Tanacetum coccineum]
MLSPSRVYFEDVFFVKELQHFNLFSVSQICDKKNKVLFTDSECLVLSPEFKLLDENQVLLKIPRQNNMYNFNLENIVPTGGLACLIAKATTNESNKWHMRLGHVNFKNLNKLVKGNLVRGLPSKIFQNDHTCVACQKGKQHKASCKAKAVSSISQTLQLLHMDLFGPTSVRSLNHKTYCLVITDDFSRTLIEAARTMLADSFLPNTFWAEAVSTACYVLNRFAGKSDEGFLVGYSLQSKAFRVYNLETKRVEENLHITFLENKPNVAGKGPTWLFDLDYLTDSMNYHHVSSENQANLHAGHKNLTTMQYIKIIGCALTTDDKREGPREEEQVFMDDLERLKKQEKEAYEEAEALRKKFETLVIKEGAAKPSSTNIFSTVSTPVKASSTNPLNTASIPVSTHRPIRLMTIIADLKQHNKKMTQKYLHLRISIKIPLMKISEALEDESWVDAMQEELLQFEIQKVWVLVDLPYGKKAIGTKWVYRNKKDERGVVVRNKARLVAQGHRQEEGIDYDEVFAHVARLEAIRIFLAFASYMGFVVYQIDVKSASFMGKLMKKYMCLNHQVFKILNILKSIQGCKSSLWATSSSQSLIVIMLEQILTGNPQQEVVNFMAGDSFLGNARSRLLWLLQLQRHNMLLLQATVGKFCGFRIKCKQLVDVSVPLDHFPVNTLTSKVFSFMVKKGKHFSRKVTPLFASMLVQPTQDEGASLERPFEALPTPSLAPASEVPYEPQTDSSPAHTSEVPFEHQPNQSPRPSHSTTTPAFILEPSGENLGGHSSSDKSLSGNEDQAKEIQALKAQITKLKKQAKPVIKHHKAYLKSVSLKQRFPRKSFSKKYRVHKEYVSKQGRKFAKGESSVQRDPLFDGMPEDTVDHMETENAQDEGRTREIVDEDKEIDEVRLSTEDEVSTVKEGVSTDFEKVSTDRPTVSTDGSKVSTDRQIEEQREGIEEKFESTDGQIKGTEDQTEEEIATQATQTSTLTPTSKIFGDDETIAKVLLNMSKAKAVSREKEKGGREEELEETIDLEKKFKQLESDEGLARKIQEEWEAEEDRNRIAEENAESNYNRRKIKVPSRYKLLLKKFLAQQRSEAIRNKPPTKNQLRNQMMTYLKHVGNYKHAELKIKKFEEVQALYEKIKRSDEDFISIGSAEDERLIKRMNEKGVDLSKSEVIKEESKEEVQEEDKDEESTRKRKLGTRKKMKSRKRRYIQNTSEDDSDKENDELRLYLTIAPDEEKEVDYEILDRKYPIKEWKTECLGTKPQTDQAEHLEEINLNVVIRSNGQKRYFSTLMSVLSIFDREDLDAVYQLVMDRFQDEMPEGFDRVLWGDLMVLFNSDDKDEFWGSQQDWKIVSWKLHSSSGVHTLVTKEGVVIHMLVEKKYPLRKEVLMQMLKLKLESEEDSTMALELIKFVKKILAELEPEEHKNWLVHKQTACGKDFSNPFMVDNLPKIVRFSTHLASVVKSWLVHDQTVHALASPKANGIWLQRSIHLGTHKVAEEQSLEFPIVEQLLDEADKLNKAVQETPKNQIMHDFEEIADIHKDSNFDLQSMLDDDLRSVSEFDTTDSDDTHENKVSKFDYIFQDDNTSTERLTDIKSSLPALVTNTLKDQLPSFLSDALKDTLPQLLKDSIKSSISKSTTEELPHVEKELSKTLHKNMRKSLRLKVRKGMKEVQDKLSFYASTMASNSQHVQGLDFPPRGSRRANTAAIVQGEQPSAQVVTNKEKALVVHNLEEMKSEGTVSLEDDLDDDEIDKQPLSKRFKITTPIPNLIPLNTFVLGHLLKPKEQQKSLHEFTNQLFGTTSLKFSPTPPRELTPPRDLAKGKEVAIMKEQVNELVTYQEEEEGSIPKMPNLNYVINSNKEATIKITRGDNLLNLIVHPNFRLKSLGFSEWLEAKKLGLPLPPALETFGMTAEEKKRKRTQFLKEDFITKDIRVDGMNRNLIPPPGVVPI